MYVLLACFLMTPPNGIIFRVTGSSWGESTGHRWTPLKKGQWRGVLRFSLTCAWTNVWANNWDNLAIWDAIALFMTTLSMDSVLLVLFFKVPWVLMGSHRPSLKMAFDPWNVFWYPFYQHRLIKIRDLYVIACIILCEIWPHIQGITSTVVVFWAWMILYGCSYNINMP